MNINWYPGHMKVSIDKIKKSLKMVDIVCEIVDARIPISSRNPLLDDIIGDFPRMIIFNKADMANPEETKKWISYFQSKGIEVIEFNALEDRKTKSIYDRARKILDEMFTRRMSKGISSNEIRMMVVGIPNVGKSTFINNVSKRRGTKVGNRPGVTRINQWINTDSDLLLLDTPGVLWPKLDTPDKGMALAYTGAIKDDNLDIETLAFNLIEKLKDFPGQLIEGRYGVDQTLTSLEIMEQIGRKIGALLRANEIDYNKVSTTVLDDFRKMRLGRITLEKVEDIK